MVSEYLWLIPALPLLGFLINGLLGSRLSEKIVGIIGSGVVFLAFLVAILNFISLLDLHPEDRVFIQSLYTWMAAGDFSVEVAFRFDPLSAVMTLIVTGVGFLIHVYSIGYMHGDRGFGRYFAFLNLFTFSMLILVLGNNFLLLFLGWEGVGLCSYLLIGFWYEKVEYANAGMKAFVVNRIGDFGFLLGMFLIFTQFGSLDFDQVFSAASAQSVGVITAICLLLFVGAVGKSAQIPLYVWLPDAMAGPTPVSALIHAATMVTAGVYMVSRASALYILSPLALSVVAITGLATAFFAATMALTSQDIKKVLAYSTISQLGYMFLGAGVGAFSAAIFHLMTHAFFKALLFLGAGSVMHALAGETSLEKMGGLRKHLPTTFWTFLVGGLAIAGIPGFSGFFSKDEILWKAFSSPFGSPILWVIGVAAAGLTAFYIFRMIFLAFYGESRVDPEVALHIHESPKVMTVPLIILAVLSVVGGYVGIPHVYQGLEHFLEPVFSHAGVAAEAGMQEPFSLELGLMAVSVVVAIIGIFIAYQMYLHKPDLPGKLAQSFRGLYQLLFHKYYIDEIYQALFVKPFVKMSDYFFFRFFDVKIIDGSVNGIARVVGAMATGLRRTQTGLVQAYALSLIIGAVILLGYFIILR